MELHIDFETASLADLRKVGLYNYANYPGTKIHCMAYSFGGDVELWLPGNPLPNAVREHVAAGGEVVAHNAQFEFAIWNNVGVGMGWPALRIEQMRCTMAQAYATALPGSLEALAIALGVDQQKDSAGSRVMHKLAKAKPVKKSDTSSSSRLWQYDDSPADFEKLYEYCKQDVRTEMACDKKLLRLSEKEQAVWRLDQAINMRGIPLDMPTVMSALDVIDSERDRLSRLMRDVTQGYVATTGGAKALTDWCAMKGVEVPGVTKGDVADLLQRENLPDDVRSALLIRQEAAKSSTAKLRAMADKAGADGRVRYTMQYHGAATGRWAGRTIQVQNFPRPRKFAKDDAVSDACVENIVELMSSGDFETIDMLYGPKLAAISDGLRGMICASPGNRLISADYANIEGRVLAWLAGEEWKLDAFRAYDAGTGHDLYLVAAARIYNIPVSEAKPYRQIGKVSELALGFGGGGQGALQNMAAVCGVSIGHKEAESIKNSWRRAHPAIVAYWYALERAAIVAVQAHGLVITAGAKGREIKFKCVGGFLFCRLPSGRLLSYPSPKLEEELVEATEDSHEWYTKKLTYLSTDIYNEWGRISTYGGKLAENVTQAVARDLLANAIFSLHNRGYLPIFHVHDEIISEVPDGQGSLAEYEAIMCELPSWADGLPVTAEGYEAKRFKK